MKCIQCVGVELEEITVKSLPGEVGYRCRQCNYIYNLQEYKRLSKQYFEVEDIDLPTREVDPDSIITIGKAGETINENIKDLLENTSVEAARTSFTDDIEER